MIPTAPATCDPGGSRRKGTSALALAVALVLPVGGCSTSQGSSGSAPTVTGSSSSPTGTVPATSVTAVPNSAISGAQTAAVTAGSPAPSSTTAATRAAGPAQAAGIPEAAFAIQGPFSGPAVTTFGQPALQSAYRELVGFAFRTGWNSTWIARRTLRLTRAELDPVLAYLTPGARDRLIQSLRAVTPANATARTKLADAMFIDLTGPGGSVPVQTGKVVRNRRFTTASATVDRTRGIRLSMAFAARADIAMLAPGGRPAPMRASRTLRFLLLRNDGADKVSRPFLIDAWYSSLTVTPAS